MAKRAKKENIFVKAKREAKESTEPKQDGRVPVKGLRRLAAIKTMIKALEALEATEEGEVKALVKNLFIERGMETGHQPKSFTGYEDMATANCQLRRRTSKSALQDEERALLDKFQIAYKEEVTQQEAYVVNEEYNDKQKDLEKISKLLVGAGYTDFIRVQPKKSTFVVSETSIEEVYAKVEKAHDVDVLLDIVGTFAMRFGFLEGHEAELFDEVLEVLKGTK